MPYYTISGNTVRETLIHRKPGSNEAEKRLTVFQ